MMQSSTLLNRRTVLGAVKARLGSTSDTQVTANAGLDRPCARRALDAQAGTKERPSARTKERPKMRSTR